jgi:hypothetical protein
VYLHSSPGTGKTCAAALLFASWPGKRQPLWIDTSQFLTSAMQARQSQPVGTTRERWGVWWDVPNRLDAMNLYVSEQHVLARVPRSGLVVLDDIGIRSPTDAKRELLLQILNLRFGEPLLVTSNLPPQLLEETFDARTASRLLAGRRVPVRGEDRRWANSRLIPA